MPIILVINTCIVKMHFIFKCLYFSTPEHKPDKLNVPIYSNDDQGNRKGDV